MDEHMGLRLHSAFDSSPTSGDDLPVYEDHRFQYLRVTGLADEKKGTGIRR